MRYVSAQIRLNRREEAYRIYITDAIKSVWRLNKRYLDIIDPPKEEKRTSEDIINHMRKKINGSV